MTILETATRDHLNRQPSVDARASAQARRRFPLRPWLHALLAGLVVSLLATPATYLLAVALSPPMTADGHRVMPIAHVGFAILAGPLLGAIAAIVVVRRTRR